MRRFVYSTCRIKAGKSAYADPKDYQNAKRDKFKSDNYDEDRKAAIDSIDWNDVAADDTKYFLNDVEAFPDLSKIKSVKYPSDEELKKLQNEKYDGAFIVTYSDGEVKTLAWKNDDEENLYEV